MLYISTSHSLLEDAGSLTYYMTYSHVGLWSWLFCVCEMDVVGHLALYMCSRVASITKTCMHVSRAGTTTVWRLEVQSCCRELVIRCRCPPPPSRPPNQGAFTFVRAQLSWSQDSVKSLVWDQDGKNCGDEFGWPPRSLANCLTYCNEGAWAVDSSQGPADRAIAN